MVMAEATGDKTGSVLVVGAGIGGMQASLDLANSGFKVYLVERGPAIGGVMSQLDKTFPTNDCAMCTLAPRMVECGNHINIEKLTYSEVESVSGTPGSFDVRVRKKARSVDPDKCTGCGECMADCLVHNLAYLDPLIPEPLDLTPDQLAEVDQIIAEHAPGEASVLPVLQGINAKYKWLPPGAVQRTSDVLGMPLARVLRVATFYNMFSFEPRGEHLIHVCLGTACYVKGGGKILEAVERQLGIQVGGTTEDLCFSLETVSCVGCCGQSPVMTIGDDIYGYLSQDKIRDILASYT